MSWGENKRNHFRLKSRGILERLVRKLDYDTVAGFVPKKHQKLMQHIRRTNERRRRRKVMAVGVEGRGVDEGGKTRRKTATLR